MAAGAKTPNHLSPTSYSTINMPPFNKDFKIKVFLVYDSDASGDEIAQPLKQILDKYYTSGISKILSYGKSPSFNSIVGEFEADGSQFYFSINLKKKTVSYSPVGINKKVTDSNSPFKINLDTEKPKTGAKTKANKSGKTLTCTPGKTYPCGAVCKAMGKPCKGLPMSPEVQKSALMLWRLLFLRR